MRITSLAVGPYRTNCYLLEHEKRSWIVDPGFESSRIIEYVQQSGLDVVAVLLTHTHWDHVMGLPDLMTTFPSLRLFAHRSDAVHLGAAGGLKMATLVRRIDPWNEKKFRALLERLPEATDLLDGDENLDMGHGRLLHVLHTPGHTPGSVCFHDAQQGVLFSGDTLFYQAIGRTDVPGGDQQVILASIRSKLLTLAGDTVVLPGHGRSSTIAQERQNPWLTPGVL